MPSLASIVNRIFTKQKMCYWAKQGSLPSGAPAYAAVLPDVPCRWEDKVEEVILPDGRKVTSRSYILLTTQITVGSLVALGSFGTIPSWPNPPTYNQGGREVIKVNTTPDVKNRSVIYEAWVK